MPAPITNCARCGGILVRAITDAAGDIINDPTPIVPRDWDGARRWVCGPCADSIDAEEALRRSLQ